MTVKQIFLLSKIGIEYKSHLRNNEHYLSSSENEALLSLLLEYVHYCEGRFHIHFFIHSSQI